MKKYLTILFPAMIFCGFLVGQIVFDRMGTFARQSSVEKKLAMHYESVFAKSTFTDFKGKKIFLAEMAAPIVILNFWASWCSPCLRELPSLNSLYKKYGPEKVLVLGVNADEEDQENSIAKIVQRYGINFPIVPDKYGTILQDFLVTGIPISLIFHRGKAVEVLKGEMDFSSFEMMRTLDRLLETEK